MNDLNQVIIEGEVSNLVTEQTLNPVLKMEVTSRHMEMGDKEERRYTFNVVAYGVFVGLDIKPGDKVRVVGCLKSDNGKVYIHTEFLERKRRAR